MPNVTSKRDTPQLQPPRPREDDFDGNEVPLIRYSIGFPHKPLLLGGIATNDITTEAMFHEVSEQLSDEIQWEPHVDEADKLDYIVAVSSGVL